MSLAVFGYWNNSINKFNCFCYQLYFYCGLFSKYKAFYFSFKKKLKNLESGGTMYGIVLSTFFLFFTYMLRFTLRGAEHIINEFVWKCCQITQWYDTLVLFHRDSLIVWWTLITWHTINAIIPQILSWAASTNVYAFRWAGFILENFDFIVVEAIPQIAFIQAFPACIMNFGLCCARIGAHAFVFFV